MKTSEKTQTTYTCVFIKYITLCMGSEANTHVKVSTLSISFLRLISTTWLYNIFLETTLYNKVIQAPYPCKQIKVRSNPIACKTKKHGGSQHPRPVVATKSGHPTYDRRNDLKRSISPPLTFRLLPGNEASYKIICLHSWCIY